jgi:hypothetical protein
MMSNLADQLEQMRARANEIANAPDANTDGLTAQLEQMRIRMNEVARREGYLTAELNAAIRRMDDELLHEVRSMAAEHEARRAHILSELEAFAAKLNGLSAPGGQRSALGGGPRSLLTNSPPSAPRPSLEQDNRQRALRDALTRHLTQQGHPH